MMIPNLQRQRLSFANWAWLRHKGWIQQDIGPARRPPRWADLITSDDCFDVFKFQNLAVTLIVCIALLLAGLAAKQGADPSQALASFKIDGTLLGLLGLSQAAYVGGKAVAPGPVTELNQKLDQVRDLERKFKEAVATAWTATPPPSRDQAQGQAAAPAEYQAYLAAANEAMTMVDERIGGRHPTARIEPDLP